MLRKLRARIQSEETGFTLIELLLVILIIAILAGIALPNFLHYRTRAQDGSAKSDARNMVSQMESCYTDNQTYTGCPGSPTGLNVGSGQGQVEVTVDTPSGGYTVVAHSRSANDFTITKQSNGTVTRTCTVGGGDRGLCPASNTW